MTVSSEQRQTLDNTFLKDAVMERLKDDVPEVVAAALKVLEVSKEGVWLRLQQSLLAVQCAAHCFLSGGSGAV